MKKIIVSLIMMLCLVGCGYKSSYHYPHIPKIESNDEKEIIATCGDGLYAKTMGGGSVNPVTGEFNFAVNEGYLVKDGKIAHPVRGASLIGRGSEVLLKIDRVGKNLELAQGMCGSMSGSVPTDVGQPMIRVGSLTVGGR